MSRKNALVAGVTGIAGQSVARKLVQEGWNVYGLSRRNRGVPDGVNHVPADLLDAEGTKSAVKDLKPEVVFITAWIKKDTEQENIVVNSATIRNLLEGLDGAGVRHVALLTGLKHYLGPFDAYGSSVTAETPFHESEPRLPNENFYYNQEDIVFEMAKRQGFTWSVHRAHTIFGFAVDNAMNMTLTLSVYATICKKLNRKFVFPGSKAQWNFATDVTDADLLGEQMLWAATNPNGENEAFNICNGDVFRWRWLWPQIAMHFQLEWEGFENEPRPLSEQMEGLDSVWEEIAKEHGLMESDLSKLASWWHTDGDLGREIECLTDMNKSKEAGFTNFRNTVKSFFDKVDRYRAAKFIP